MPNAEYELDLPWISFPKMVTLKTARLLWFCGVLIARWWLLVLAAALVVWCLPLLR
ncbi:MAG: hypothetical protein QF660_03415 [Anaerolineales bacterium]|nr:hypothetical protein [Anaerolineales bacterium]